MKITFLGGAQTVTGSMHLLTIGSSRVLLDCGLFQGRRKEAHERNSKFPKEATTADACILSHAHIDHSGNLPSLVRRGFEGAIHMTRATKDLCDPMLRDSANLQKRDYEHLTKRGIPVLEPLYDDDDVTETLGRIRPARYGSWADVAPGVRVRFLDAGHILGSAVVHVEATEGGSTRSICFTGDLGRRGMPILRDPEHLPSCDVVITESTYGDRVHSRNHETETELAGFVKEQFERGGRIVIPAFSLGRTQNLVYALYRIYKRGDAPRLPIYVDSPLATRVTKIVAAHPECFDEEALGVLGARGAPFYFPEIHYTDSVEESKALNGRGGPMIVISASGMCEGGRVLHHLKHSIQNPTTLILLVGYQAQMTLGRRILEGAERVRIYGQELEVKARIRKMNAMSAHADRDDLLHYLKPVSSTCGKIFVVHGEPRASASLADALRGSGCADVKTPDIGDTFEL